MAPDDYLWDKSGPPDPEVEKLERSLAPLAHTDAPWQPPAEQVAERPGIDAPRGWFASWRARIGTPALAGAFAAALVAVGAMVWWLATPRNAGWEVAAVTGTPRVADRPLAARDRWRAGDWLVTDAGSQARLKVGELGFVEVAPRSRALLVAARDDEHRLSLAVGRLQAIIIAPPRRFTVETPAAHAVDLGCAYTIEVSGTGETVLTVDIGWVSFETGGLESFVPAGARAVTRPGRLPGTPYFTDAPFALKNALAALDFGVAGHPAKPGPAGAAADSAAQRSTALDAALAAARREDALTLWHLLARTEGAERARVFDALDARVPAPAGVTRDGILARDAAMLDRWWDALGFGDTADWRRWRRPWGQIASR